jgi:hypothetical protein
MDLLDEDFVVDFSNYILHRGINWNSSVLLLSMQTVKRMILSSLEKRGYVGSRKLMESFSFAFFILERWRPFLICVLSVLGR